MSGITCDQVRAYLSVRGSDITIEEATAHVDECRECLAFVEDLVAKKTNAPPAAPPGEQALSPDQVEKSLRLPYRPPNT